MTDVLNAAQRQAVEAELGNLLVLAGAGSGKTRVLVNRIAWLINNNQASLYDIFAVTFTNKAANEMKTRLASILNRSTSAVWVGTFHSLAHRLLRLHWHESSLPQNFQVLDADDQLRIIRKICKQLNVDEERWELKQVQNFINRKKDDGVRANKLPHANNMFDRVMGDIYLAYEQTCNKEGFVDFGELLFRAYEVLANNVSLLEHYQARFQHFLVDEFQDTNTIQYSWLKLLASKAQSVTVVGDDDQSIYGWRGARIENIYRFEKDFPGATLIRLEQNYRSTNIILSAANAVIACNDSRLGKNLWTQKTEGELITLYHALNEEDESLFVARQIQKYISTLNSLTDIAILYRSNAQSRVLEEALMRAGIDYCIYGGVRFFERAEIKDALAYLRLVVNCHDNVAFERVINTPARGIGEQSLNKIKELAVEGNLSYWQAAVQSINDNFLTGKAGVGLRAFVNIIETLMSISQSQPLAIVVEQAINSSGLLQFFKSKSDEGSRSRVENLEELVSATNNFSNNFIQEQEPEHTKNILVEFLSYASLEAGEHRSNPTCGVQLMTLHAAKGLEFPIVFICGVEEGLFPHHWSKDDPKALEEERRLCYVGITRAMGKLIISSAERRRVFGREEIRKQSRFIQEIPPHLLDIQTGRLYTKPVISPFFTANNNKTNNGQFRLGQRVRHAKFGIGTVVDQEGVSDKVRINVHFDNVGPKWLVLSFAKLETVT
jgi:DNA helicase-2/ATP-dependent DNA helicase PcrA